MRRVHRLDALRLSLPFFLLSLALLFVPLLSLAEDPGESGGEDLLLAALQQELARSSEKLRLEGMDRPFFVEYLETGNFACYVRCAGDCRRRGAACIAPTPTASATGWSFYFTHCRLLLISR